MVIVNGGSSAVFFAPVAKEAEEEEEVEEEEEGANMPLSSHHWYSWLSNLYIYISKYMVVNIWGVSIRTIWHEMPHRRRMVHVTGTA